MNNDTILLMQLIKNGELSNSSSSVHMIDGRTMNDFLQVLHLGASNGYVEKRANKYVFDINDEYGAFTSDNPLVQCFENLLHSVEQQLSDSDYRAVPKINEELTLKTNIWYNSINDNIIFDHFKVNLGFNSREETYSLIDITCNVHFNNDVGYGFTGRLDGILHFREGEAPEEGPIPEYIVLNYQYGVCAIDYVPMEM